MKTVILLGELGKRFGRKHRLDVASPAEAVRALCANFREFRQFVSKSAERNVAYRVLNRKEEVGEDELHNPASQTITFVPVVMGAGFFKKFAKLITGAILIVASFFIAPYSPLLASITFNIGVSMTLAGVAQLLSPTPKAPNASDGSNDPSYIFNGSINTSAQGHAISVGYGRMIVGSAVISAGISVEDVTA